MATRESDYIQQLANYIKKNLGKGYTLDSLRFALVNQGYSRTEVERAIKIANEDLARQAPKADIKPQITYTAILGEEEVKTSFWERVKGWFS